MTLDELEAAIYPRSAHDHPIPVIVDIQAWREDRDTAWPDRWDDGHYVVVIGMDERNVYFEDPSLEGQQGRIPRKEFVDRWRDYEGETPETGRKYIRSGILISGKEPRPPAIARIE
jgi:uncharacterized protein